MKSHTVVSVPVRRPIRLSWPQPVNTFGTLLSYSRTPGVHMFIYGCVCACCRNYIKYTRICGSSGLLMSLQVSIFTYEELSNCYTLNARTVHFLLFDISKCKQIMSVILYT